MNPDFGPLMGLAAFDLVILALVYLSLRPYAPIDRRFLLPLGAGLGGFVFHAFVFFSGAFLVLQLATYLGVFVLYLFNSRKPSESA
jgi:hypothetical protein